MSKKNAKLRTSDKPLSEAEIFRLASLYEDHAKHAAEAEAAKKDVQKTLCVELLDRRKTSAVESSAYGEFTRITAVRNESVVYDEDGLWQELTPKERRKAFDELINLNALPLSVRKEILATLSSEQKRLVSSRKLNTERLAQAVAEDEIDARTVAAHAEIKYSAPYIRISHGAG